MSAAIEITRTEHTPEALRALACESKDSAQTRRLLAIAMVLDGASRADAARQAGMDRQTLRDWVHRYNASGVDGLIARQAPGAAPKLSAEQKHELKDIVLAGPDPEKHKVFRWRCIDLRGQVQERFKVTVHEYTISRWLHELGLSRLQPRPFHPQKDDAAQEAYKKTSPAG